MQTSFIDPRRNSAIPSKYFPDTCTIQTLVESVDTEGELTEAWSNYEGHIDLDCSVKSADGDETASASLTYATASHNISLNGYYPTITAAMRAVVNEVNYDILVPKHSGYDTTTMLDCKVTDV